MKILCADIEALNGRIVDYSYSSQLCEISNQMRVG
jgi:hypothetical protein